MTILREYVSV